MEEKAERGSTLHFLKEGNNTGFIYTLHILDEGVGDGCSALHFLDEGKSEGFHSPLPQIRTSMKEI